MSGEIEVEDLPPQYFEDEAFIHAIQIYTVKNAVQPFLNHEFFQMNDDEYLSDDLKAERLSEIINVLNAYELKDLVKPEMMDTIVKMGFSEDEALKILTDILDNKQQINHKISEANNAKESV